MVYFKLIPKVSLEDRMTRIARQVGRVLSGDTDNYSVREKPRTRNLIDNLSVIRSEVRKGTQISTLFPDATMHYFPGLELPSTLSHLYGRISDKPFTGQLDATIMGEKVRAIYQQADEKQFFFTNGNIPDEMKNAVRKITQPTSRRIGSALSYVAVGDAFRNNENNLDGAACSYYSALLLAHNLAASSLEKASVKQLVYQRMKQIAEARKQPYLAELFGLGADLNTSYINDENAQLSHREYYSRLQKTSASCVEAENQARAIRAQARASTFQAILEVGSAVAQVAAGKTMTNNDVQVLTNRVISYAAPVEQSKGIFAEFLNDLKYENFDVLDESGNEVELNKLYLNIEIMWHIGLRKDKMAVGKRLLAYAADKPNLKISLEECLAETDDNQLTTVYAEFRKSFSGIEEQANRYESWGKPLPKKVVGRF